MLRRLCVLALSLATWGTAGSSASAAPLSPRDIYRAKGKGVVLVFGTDGSAQGSAGTGSVISKDGEIITNAHVVAKDGQQFKKIFAYIKPDKLRGSMKDDLENRVKVTVVDIDHELDLALLRMVDPPPGLPIIDFVDPDAVEVGEPVVAIGHPETGGLWTLTSGTISAVISDFQGVPGKDVFQTDASVNRGNSGGPLLNAYGQMIGINTSISRRAADGLAITAINFSLKSSVAVEWLKRRKLLLLAYVRPDVEATTPVGAPAKPAVEAPTAVAMADKGASEAKPATSAAPAGDAKTTIAVVAPAKGQDVADDPEFRAAAAANVNVSRGVDGQKAADDAQKAKVQPKHLTKARPYELDTFVGQRIQEIKAMEKMMDEMGDELDRKTGGKKKRPKQDGMGLW